MVRYFIIIKRKSAKEWEAATPAKPGKTLAQIKQALKGKVRKGYTIKIITSNNLRTLLRNKARMILKKKPKPARRRTSVKRKVKRKTRRR